MTKDRAVYYARGCSLLVESSFICQGKNMKTPKRRAKGVRFQTDEGDIVVPEKVNSFERASTAGRTKAAEALDYLLAGNKRFQTVCCCSKMDL